MSSRTKTLKPPPSPPTAEDLLDVFRRVVPSDYAAAVENDPSFAIFRAMAAMWARVAEAGARSIQARYYLPSAYQTHPPASSGVKASGYMKFARQSRGDLSVLALPGELSVVGPGERIYLNVDPVLWNPGDMSEKTVLMRCEVDGFLGNLDALADENGLLELDLFEILNQDHDKAAPGGSVAGSLGFLAVVKDSGRPDLFGPTDQGLYLLVNNSSAPSNVGKIRKINKFLDSGGQADVVGSGLYPNTLLTEELVRVNAADVVTEDVCEIDDDFLATSPEWRDEFTQPYVDAVWTRYTTPGGVITASGGSLLLDPTANVGFAASPNRQPGPWVHREVVGDFDVRGKFWVRNDADTAEAPQTSFRYGCLVAAETETGASNWVEVFTGVTNSAPTVRYGSTSADSAGVLTIGSSISTTSTRRDLRMVRRGQVFTLLTRPHNASVGLSSDVGWVVTGVFDRTVDPLSNTLRIGAMVRSTDASDTLVKVDDMLLYEGTGIDPDWTLYSPVASARFSQHAGDLRITPGTVGSGLTAAPNRAPGPRAYQSITGDFDARMRGWLRNGSDNGNPSTPYALLALYVSATESGPSSWLECSIALDPGVPTVRLSYARADAAGAVTGLYADANGEFHNDLRITRSGDTFTLQARNYSTLTPLSSDEGWSTLTTYSAAALGIGASVLVGPMLRTTTGGVDCVGRVEELTIRTDLANPQFVDHWDEASSNDELYFHPYPPSPQQHDTLYVGASLPFKGLSVELEAGEATWEVAWEYWNGSTWTTLPALTDRTAGWTTTANGLVNDPRTIAIEWELPTDWAPSQSPVGVNVSRYYARARLSSFSSQTTAPQIQRLTVHQHDPLQPDAGSLTWAVLDYGSMGVSLVEVQTITGGRDDDLYVLGAERGLYQQPGETDDQFRRRITLLPDQVTPNAVRRVINRALSPYGYRGQAIDVGNGLTGFFYDVPASSAPDMVCAFDMYEPGDASPLDPWILPLSAEEAYGFGLVLVPNMGLGEFGMFYDDGPVYLNQGYYNSYTGPAFGGWPDGYPVTDYAIYSSIYSSVRSIISYGVKFAILRSNTP